MTGTLLSMTVIFMVAVGLLIHSTVKYARLEMAYHNLRRVNKILQERLNNSEERPF